MQAPAQCARRESGFLRLKYSNVEPNRADKSTYLSGLCRMLVYVRISLTRLNGLESLVGINRFHLALNDTILPSW